MAGNPAFGDIKSDPTLFIRKPNLNLIIEEIEKPCYIISEATGDAILLEECLFWTEKQLISEGILDKVLSKVEEIYNKIKNAVVSIISESSGAIKAFCEKVMNSSIVKAIREKLGLDSKINKGVFSKFAHVKDPNGKEVQGESSSSKNGVVVVEAAKLSAKEEAIDDPDVIKQYIQKYQDALSGKNPLKNKLGKPLSEKYIKTRIKLFQEKLDELEEEEEEEEEEPDNSSNKSSDETPKSSAKSAESSDSKKGGTNAGSVVLDVNGMQNHIKNVCTEATSDEKAKAASADAAKIAGGDEAVKAMEGANGESGEKKEEKKGFFSKVADKVGNAVKSGVQKVTGAAKEWFAKQNKFVKLLIWVIIGVMAIFALYLVITSVIMPILAVIIHGGIVAAGGAVFQLYAAGKTFKATYKAGKNAWDTGTGWGKFFMLLGGCVLACLSIKSLVAKGNEIMSQSKSDAPSAGESSSKESSSKNDSSKEGSSKESSGGKSGEASGAPEEVDPYTLGAKNVDEDDIIKNIIQHAKDTNTLPDKANFYSWKKTLFNDPQLKAALKKAGCIDADDRQDFWRTLDLKAKAAMN